MCRPRLGRAPTQLPTLNPTREALRSWGIAATASHGPTGARAAPADQTPPGAAPSPLPPPPRPGTLRAGHPRHHRPLTPPAAGPYPSHPATASDDAAPAASRRGGGEIKEETDRGGVRNLVKIH